MAQNRLEIIIGAQDREFRSALRRLQADARSSGADIARSFDNAGDGASALEQTIEETADSFSRLSDEAASELGRVEGAASRAGSSLNFLDQALENAGYSVGALNQVEEALDDIAEAAEDAGDELTDAFKAQALADFAGQVSQTGKEIGQFFENAAEDARNIDRELRKTFADPKDVERFSKIVGDLKAEFGDLANSEGLTKALQKLESGGIASEKELRRVINIAEATGRSYEEIAEKQAEFFASAKGGVVNVQVLNEYRKTIGAGAKDLEEFGVKLDENNNIIAKTPEDIKAAQDALRKYLDGNKRFNDVLERAQDNQDKLNAQVGALNESLGLQVNEFKNVVAGGLLPFVKGLNNSSDSIKKFVGLSIAGGSAIAEYGGKTVEFVAHAKAAGLSVGTLTGGIQKATIAVRAFAASTAGMVAGLAVAVAGLALITKSALDYADALDQAEKAEQSLASTQAKALIASKDRVKSINQSIDALEKEYSTIEDFAARRTTITKDILVKENALQKARDENDTKRAGQLAFEIEKLRRIREGYDKQGKSAEDAVKREETARKKASAAFKKETEERRKVREQERKETEAAAKLKAEIDKAAAKKESDRKEKEAKAAKAKAEKDAKAKMKAEEKAKQQAKKKADADAEKELLKTLVAQRKEREAKRELAVDSLEKLKNEIEAEKELLEQLKAQNEERKRAQGFATSFGATSDATTIGDESFGRSNLPSTRNTTEDGRTAQDLEKSIARKQEQTRPLEAQVNAPSPIGLDSLLQAQTQSNVTQQQLLSATQTMAQNIGKLVGALAAQQQSPDSNAGDMFATGGSKLPGLAS